MVLILEQIFPKRIRCHDLGETRWFRRVAPPVVSEIVERPYLVANTLVVGSLFETALSEASTAVAASRLVVGGWVTCLRAHTRS